jgi:hypothetical protein
MITLYNELVDTLTATGAHVGHHHSFNVVPVAVVYHFYTTPT